MAELRYGFTTGSCSAAAAKAATYMLLTGKVKNEIEIETPKGIMFKAEILEIERTENFVCCAVRKDGGDDPDVTTGALVFARVSLIDGRNVICIDGGEGVGRVTKPGLDQPVGNAAINHVPREMITKEVLEICKLCDFTGGVSVIISVPQGEEIAKKTFNPRLGIVGGISILGTSGIVEPMSEKALLDTISVEISQKMAEAKQGASDILAVSPGNYGLDFMKRTFDYDLDKSVKCSNYIGDTIDMAVKSGFTKMLLTGHIGKLIKVSGGIMNTHSKEGDCRMELMVAAGLRNGLSSEGALKILDAVSTEEGAKLLKAEGVLELSMRYAMEKIMFFLNKRGNGRIKIECIMYSNELGLLAESEGAREYLEQICEQGHGA